MDVGCQDEGNLWKVGYGQKKDGLRHLAAVRGVPEEGFTHHTHT